MCSWAGNLHARRRNSRSCPNAESAAKSTICFAPDAPATYDQLIQLATASGKQDLRGQPKTGASSAKAADAYRETKTASGITASPTEKGTRMKVF